MTASSRAGPGNGREGQATPGPRDPATIAGFRAGQAGQTGHLSGTCPEALGGTDRDTPPKGVSRVPRLCPAIALMSKVSRHRDQPSVVIPGSDMIPADKRFVRPLEGLLSGFWLGAVRNA